MNSKTTGVVFPAFAMKFVGSHPDYQDEMDRLLPLASNLVPIDSERFKEMTEGVIEDELQAHYFCYINACIASTILRNQNIDTDYAAGYSMGLYGALFHSDVVSFENGLLLMHDIYNIALGSIDATRYGMAVVVGLTFEDVDNVIQQHCDNVDIIDVSNEHVINVTGIYDEVVDFMNIVAERAINTKMLPITLPYHSRFMKRATDKIGEYLRDVHIEPPLFGIVSCVNQKVLSTAQDIKDELYCNVSQRINWFKTMQKMLELNVNLFVECGMSKSLTQLAKFIDGNYKIYNITNLSKLPRNEN